MSKNRKKAEARFLELIAKIIDGDENIDLYKQFFASLSDRAFDELIVSIEKGERVLPILVPNLKKNKLSITRNLALAKELNHDFFQRLWMKPSADVPRYLTPIKYLVVELPVARQAQLLTKKISIPEHNRSVDDLTGQPTGDSKGSKISFPETQILAALGLDKTTKELLKYRGGDLDGFNAMNKAIETTGGVRLDALDVLGTTVTSMETLSTFLTCMHLENTLK